jgi:predicted nucleic acid-binding protein
VRTLDLLHVAAAVSLGAKNFITCDGRQLALANAAGLHANKI